MVEVKPVRLQLSRRKGFSLQAISRETNGLEAVNVARPGIFGNPFTAKGAIEAGYLKRRDEPLANLFLSDCFTNWVTKHHVVGEPGWWMGPESESRRYTIRTNLHRLTGKNLACWCGPGPCHADALLCLANPSPGRKEHRDG